MYLATTALTECWTKNDEIILLGPWCLAYERQAEWQGLNWKMAPNPWKDPRAIERAEQYCSAVIDSVLGDLSSRLNRLHGTHHGKRYWCILLGPWLLYYVHALYDRYVSLKQVLEQYHGLESTVLSHSAYQTPKNTFDFVDLAYGESADRFNLQLYSQILEEPGFKGILKKEIAHFQPEPPNVTVLPRRNLPSRVVLKRWLKSMTERVSLRLPRLMQPKVMLGRLTMNTPNLLRLVAAMAFRGCALPSPLGVNSDDSLRDEVMRETLSDRHGSDEFTAILYKTLPMNFPFRYLEGYGNFRDACLDVWPKVPLVLVSSQGWYFDDAFKFLAAEFSERGSRLVGIQSGGGYGTSKLIPQEKLERDMTDRWFSYGWQERGGEIPINALPHPKFLPLTASFKAHRKDNAKSILLVTTSHPKYPFRLESHPVGEFHTVLEWRSRFLATLNDSHRAAIVIRLRPVDYGWFQRQQLIERFGQLRFDEGIKPLQSVLEQTRLVVVEYLGTSCLEVLSANVPSVLFWDPLRWELRNEAKPYFHALRLVGILHDSAETAARKIEEIYSNPWTWWGRDEVQEARRRFVDRFAVGRKDWVDCWAKALEEEMALSQVKDS